MKLCGFTLWQRNCTKQIRLFFIGGAWKKQLFTIAGAFVLSGILVHSTVSAGVISIPFQPDDVNLHLYGSDGSKTQFPDQGVLEANNTIMAVVHWLQLILGAIATVWMVWKGFSMLAAGSDHSAYESAKKSIVYGIVGLVVSFLADPLVRTVLYGGAGGLLPGQAILSPETSTLNGRNEIYALMNMLKTFIAVISVIMIVVTGIQAMLSLDDESETKKQTTNIRWIMIGIVTLIFNEILINYGLYGSPHLVNNKPVTVRDPIRVITEMSGFVSYMLTFFAVLAVLGIVYGGYLVLAGQFDSGQADKGKKIIKNVALGMLIVLVSYALVRTVIMWQV